MPGKSLRKETVIRSQMQGSDALTEERIREEAEKPEMSSQETISSTPQMLEPEQIIPPSKEGSPSFSGCDPDQISRLAKRIFNTDR